MTNVDPRKGNSFYYDLDVTPLPDLPFYFGQVTKQMSVLELGCGTGRVLIPLATKCREIIGVDYSADMVSRCQEKMRAAGTINAHAQVGDITDLDLKRKFDLVLAPYRVMQALETDHEVAGFLTTVRNHLAVGGAAILNVFRPKRDKEDMRKNWCQPGEEVRWEKTFADGTRVVHSEWYEKMDNDKMVIFPQLIYRKFRGKDLLEEHIQKIKMRCYYPDEFKGLVESHGFRIEESWGGYEGQSYGQGPELIIKLGL